MAEKCKIVYNDGVAGVFNNDGSPSSLYNEALEYYGDQEEALQAWQTAYTEEYKEIIGKSPETTSLSDVLNFLSNYGVSNSALTSEEFSAINQFMTYNGINSLYDLNNKLNSSFKNKGYFEISTRRLVRSGLYTQEEANDLDPNQMLNLLNKINAVSDYFDFSVVNIPQNKGLFRNPNGEKTIFGTYKAQSIEDVAEFIVKNSPSYTEADVISTLANSQEYAYIAGELQSKSSLKNELISIASQYAYVPKVYMDLQGNATYENFSEETTIKNTILSDVDPIELQADIEFLDSIYPDVWLEKNKEVKNILQKIEEYLIKDNVDVIGISNKAEFDREGVILLLELTSDMLMNPSPENISRFAQVKRELLGQSDSKAVVPINLKKPELNIVYSEMDMSVGEMFDSHNMLKIADNTYHVVNINTQEAYDELYSAFLLGRFSIPQEFITTEDPMSPDNYSLVIESLKSYINSRDIGFDAVNHEQASLAQVIFNHPAPGLNLSPSEVVENEDYLKTEFVSDFYQYTLEEKMKGSDTYDKILKHFSFSDTDINLNSVTTPNIKGIKYENELRNYAKLKKEGQIRLLIGEVNTGSDIDLEVMNNPSLVKEIQNSNFSLQGDYLFTLNSPDLYTRIGNDVYRKIKSDINGQDVYKLVNPNTDNVYFASDINFDINERDIPNNILIAPRVIDTTFTEDNLKIDNKVKEVLNPVTPENLFNQLDLITESDLFTLTYELDITQTDVQELIDNGIVQYKNEFNEICAEIGIKTPFKKGHKWSLVKEIEGDSHKNGGVDIALTNGGVILKNNDSEFKAKDGLVIPSVVEKFTRGKKWKIVKELKGSSHKEGGIDIELTDNGVKLKNNNSEIKAKYGLVINKKDYK